ncbi:MAG TPA: hypothetical protein VF721_22690 [Pyrinomonadaceae bacterium]|jgi:hypothetical protein
MKSKIGVLVLVWASMFIFLPVESSAAEANSAVNNNAEYNLQWQNGRGRGRGRGRDDNDDWRRSRSWRNRSWNRNNSRAVRSRGFRLVRQTFWRNGRRHTRTVRVY